MESLPSDLLTVDASDLPLRLENHQAKEVRAMNAIEITTKAGTVRAKGALGVILVSVIGGVLLALAIGAVVLIRAGNFL